MASRPKAPRLTADNKILISQPGQNIMQGLLSIAIGNETAKEKAQYKYKGNIKPSSLSLTMCFESYQETCCVYREWGLKNKLSFLYGNAIHHWIGRYLAVNYPESYFKPVIPDAVSNWYGNCWPEVPIRNSAWHASALIDYPARIRQEPVVIDWKTTWRDDSVWSEFHRRPYISPEYILQLMSYLFLLEQEPVPYFPFQPQRAGLVFINLKVDPDDPFMWKEVYFEYQDYRSIVHGLWELAVEAVEAVLAGKKIPCKNPYCKEHGNANARTELYSSSCRQFSESIREVSHALIKDYPYLATEGVAWEAGDLPPDGYSYKR